MNDTDGVSTPSTPVSFKSALSLPALDPHHEVHGDVKLALDNHPPVRKSGRGANTSSGVPGVDEGANRQVYAPEEDVGEGRGAAGGVGEQEEWDGMDPRLKAAIIAAVRSVERQMHAPALIAGRSLVAVMESEGVPQDTDEEPEVASARPEDLGTVAQQVAPATEETQPRRSLPAGLLDGDEVELDDFLAEREPEWQLEILFPEEYQAELRRIRDPAYQYGKVLRKKEIHAEKARKLAELRRQRQAEHDATWEAWVERGKLSVDENGVDLPLPDPFQDEASTPASTSASTSTPVNDGSKKKEKIAAATKKFLAKYGPKFAKFGGKLALDGAEHALEDALDQIQW